MHEHRLLVELVKWHALSLCIPEPRDMGYMRGGCISLLGPGGYRKAQEAQEFLPLDAFVNKQPLWG